QGSQAERVGRSLSGPGDRRIDLGRLTAVRVDPAQTCLADGRARLHAGCGDQLIERADLVAGPDLARVHRVVPELVVLQRPVLVADQPVAVDDLRVELDLTAGVPRDHGEG